MRAVIQERACKPRHHASMPVTFAACLKSLMNAATSPKRLRKRHQSGMLAQRDKGKGEAKLLRVASKEACPLAETNRVFMKFSKVYTQTFLTTEPW